MGKRAEQAAATRERVLAAARQMMRDGALADTALDELALRAETTRATVYRLFRSKQALMQAVTWDELSRARIDRLDAAHQLQDVRSAVHQVLVENCRMFAALGETLPTMLERSRHDPDLAAIVDATYHGRRHESMKRLARRIVKSERAKAGWTAGQIADALLVLTSFESFETLTRRRGRSPRVAADELFALAGAFLE